MALMAGAFRTPAAADTRDFVIAVPFAVLEELEVDRALANERARRAARR